ncbi:hypothetical protein [Niallia sp. MER TA 168]|uniref:hypothetical protein n=1 Tax=Niallia sp. MER TA 168 TaxID=2939568 RepID=UPI002041FA31|nr:hypothetical protein [Niallia sp. MER TA 168]MCM3362543.1 hypothetical protein [Niallia sp. MER TA 168]
MEIEEIYRKLDEDIYTFGDHFSGGEEHKYISSEALISKSLLEDLREVLDENQNGYDQEVVNKVLHLVRYNGPINNYANFNENVYAGEILSELPYEEDSDPGEIAGNQAADKRQDLLNEASDDIKELMEALSSLL